MPSVEIVVQPASRSVEHDPTVTPTAADFKIGQGPLNGAGNGPENGGGEIPVVTVRASPSVAFAGVEAKVAALRAGEPAGELPPKGMVDGQHLSLDPDPP